MEIDYNTSTVYVDGSPWMSPIILEPMVAPDPSDTNYGTYWEVPEGCIFVMGTTATTPPTAGMSVWARWRWNTCWAGPSAPSCPSSTSAWWSKGVRPCDWTNGSRSPV